MTKEDISKRVWDNKGILGKGLESIAEFISQNYSEHDIFDIHAYNFPVSIENLFRLDRCMTFNGCVPFRPPTDICLNTLRLRLNNKDLTKEEIDSNIGPPILKSSYSPGYYQYSYINNDNLKLLVFAISREDGECDRHFMLAWNGDQGKFIETLSEIIRYLNEREQSHYKNFSELRKKEFLDKIFLPEGVKEKTISIIEKFINNRKKYVDMKIPWKTGFLLHGIPGSGKTSLIKAVSRYFGLKTMDLLQRIRRDGSIDMSESEDTNVSSVSDLLKKIFDNPSSSGVCHGTTQIDIPMLHKMMYPYSVMPCIYYLEDIERTVMGPANEDGASMQLHRLLNAIDGYTEIDGAILFATSNNLSAIHDAILGRPGRFQHVIEFTEPCGEQIEAMLLYHNYTVDDLDIDDIVSFFIKKKFSMDFIEKIILTSKLETDSNNIPRDIFNSVVKGYEEHKKTADKFSIKDKRASGNRIGIHLDE